jgi:2-methylcitrate dehydratase PrpD
VTAGVASGASAQLITQAIGVAAGMAGGLHASVLDGSQTKCIHAGLAARAGLSAFEFAQAGFPGPRSALDGPKGFLRAMADISPDRDRMVGDLGKHWEVLNLAVKTYPSCQATQPYIDCALALQRRYQFAFEDVRSIDVRVGAGIGISLCEPRNVKVAPPSAYGAKFSIPFTIAAAMVLGSVRTDAFSDERLADPAILKLANKVVPSIDSAYDEGTALRGWLKVTTTAGDEIVESTDAARGTVENPLSVDEVVEKFRWNVRGLLPEQSAEEIVDMVLRFDDLDNVGDLLARTVVVESARSLKEA